MFYHIPKIGTIQNVLFHFQGPLFFFSLKYMLSSTTRLLDLFKNETYLDELALLHIYLSALSILYIVLRDRLSPTLIFFCSYYFFSFLKKTLQRGGYNVCPHFHDKKRKKINFREMCIWLLFIRGQLCAFECSLSLH